MYDIFCRPLIVGKLNLFFSFNKIINIMLQDEASVLKAFYKHEFFDEAEIKIYYLDKNEVRDILELTIYFLWK